MNRNPSPDCCHPLWIVSGCSLSSDSVLPTACIGTPYSILWLSWTIIQNTRSCVYFGSIFVGVANNTVSNGDAAQACLVRIQVEERDYACVGSSRFHHDDDDAFSAKVQFRVYKHQGQARPKKHFSHSAQNMADIFNPSRLRGARTIPNQIEGMWFQDRFLCIPDLRYPG